MRKPLFFAAILAALVCSCKQNSVSQPVKLADYLWEITVDEYPAEAPNRYAKDLGTDFACSSVRNGNYYGRNLDLYIREEAEIVVHTPAKENRHATLGVGRLFGRTDADLAAGITREQYEVLPWVMLDGINDAGLFCNINVTPFQDSGLPHTSPNPELPEVYCGFLIRALLDNCATVDEAIEYVNTHSVVGMNKGGMDFHFMIGDPQKTVVLEFIDNKAVFQEHVIMTNFLVNAPELTPHADGIERYAILREHYAEGGESMEGMWNLLKRVRFSQAYDPETNPFWKTEFLGADSTFTIDTPAETIMAHEKVQEDIANFRHYKETGEYSVEMGMWYTEHNSTYDIANKILWVTMHENYDKKFSFVIE